VHNTNATYPDCCGKVVCDSVEGNEIDVGKCEFSRHFFLGEANQSINPIV
jgi:hypothetical protein